MQKYVDQLLCRMKDAANDSSLPVDPKILYPGHPSMGYQGMEYIAEWEMGQMSPAEELFNISKIEFPPVNKLNPTQIEVLIDGILTMIKSINNHIDLPDEMPEDRKYELIVGLWEEGFQPISTGTQNIDFCTGHSPDCELKEYCQCREIWNNEDG